MKENHSDDQLKDVFKSKFANEYMAPPEDAWAAIANALPTKERKKRPFIFWWLPIGLVVLVGTGFLINSQFSKTRYESTLISSTTENATFQNNQTLKEKDKNKTTIIAKENASNEADLSSLQTNLDQGENLNNSKSSTKHVAHDQKKKSHQKRKSTETGDGRNAEGINSKGNSSSAGDLVSNLSKAQLKVKGNAGLMLEDEDITNERTISDIDLKGDTRSVKPDDQKTEPVEATRDNAIDEEQEEVADNITVENEVAPNTELDPVDSNLQTNQAANLPDSSKVVPSVLTPPLVTESSFKRFRFDIYAGIGRSPRQNTVLADENILILTDSKVQLKNRLMGFNVRYQITPHFGVRSGVGVGINRYRSRFFPVSIPNDQLNQNVEIATADGVLRLVGLESNALPSNNADTSTFVMRVVHRSTHLFVPVSIYFNTTMKPKKVYFYGATGVDFATRIRERNAVIVRSSGNDRDVSLERLKRGISILTNWHVNAGLAFPFENKVELFTELNYSLNISNDLKSNYLKTNFSYFQVILGLRF